MDVINDMQELVTNMGRVNPRAEIILTVSPVPLAATAEPQAHVLAATTYSKSVLRVAADELRAQFPRVHYFPSYEIITGNFSRGAYYAEDLRNVTEAGVSHVMGLFLKHATGSEASASVSPSGEQTDSFIEIASAFVAVECDEVALDRT